MLVIADASGSEGIHVPDFSPDESDREGESEFIGGMPLTKSLGIDDVAAERMGNAIEEVRASGLEQSVFMRWVHMFMQFIGEYSTTLTWCAAAVLMVNGRATIGEVVGFMGVLVMLRNGVYTWMGAYDAWQSAQPGMAALLELIDSRELEEFQQPAKHIPIAGGLITSDNATMVPTADSAPNRCSVS